ncbi:MAG: sulfide/dihydroorotate dehydrogenase-like FAD/NAD-binding protein [Nanoarchaeota archaeon]|nr:sulfide/dihydroorotate dehydrogenase-like FAD/NAD-binding protein [Nanoarchaeota archaeon]
MYPVLQKKKLAKDIYLLEVEAPEIAKKAKPGQFIILRINQNGERIPLTIADKTKKSIFLVFLVVGKTTELLSCMKKNDKLLDLVGPLGDASEISEFGSVCLIGGGLGIAPIYPIAKALKKLGNRIIVILGAKTKKLLFWEDKFQAVADEIIICTDDGSKGIQGFVTDGLKSLMQKERPNRVVVIGPPIMMKSVAEMTRHRIKTIASLNPIMVDGMGMCGGCRVIVGEQVKFACCDGPEFDAHLVDWDDLMNRNRVYLDEEKICKGGCKHG